MKLYEEKRETPGVIRFLDKTFCSECCKELILHKEVGSIVLNDEVYEDELPFYLNNEDAAKYKPEPTTLKIRVYRCPKCGRLYSDNLEELEKLYPDEYKEVTAQEMLSRFVGYSNEGITYNEETGCVSLYRVSMDYLFINKNPQKAFVKKIPTIIRISLNLKTGAIYEYSSGRNGRGLERKDFNTLLQAYYFGDEMIIRFARMVFEKTGLPVECSTYTDDSTFARVRFTLTCGDSKISSLDNSSFLSLVAWLVKAPSVWIRYDSYKNTVSFRYTRTSKGNSYYFDGLYTDKEMDPASIRVYTPLSNKFKKVFATSRSLTDEGEYVKTLVERTGAPSSKGLMQLYRKNPLFIGYAKWLNECNIKEIDNIYKMFNFFDQMEYWSRSLIAGYKRLIKALVASCGETNAVNKLLMCRTCDEFYDAAKMFAIIDKNGIKADLTGTFKDIHDEVSDIYRVSHADLTNRTIPYTKAEQKREFADGEISIKLADDTKKLIEIGQAMHICVGSYGDVALTKKCTIYYAERNGEYAACFEVRKGTLVQAKGYCNKFLQGEVAKTVKKWVKETKLLADKCYDFNQMSLSA